MPPLTAAGSASTSTSGLSKTPRLVLYQQTHHTPTDEPISILPLVTNRTGLTHLYIAAFHINAGPGNISLNDHPPSDSRYNQLWSEVQWLQGAGVKVMGMLGGAAKGTYERLSGDDGQFEAYYTPLKEVITRYKLQGVDLDIEEPMTLAHLERLILRLKKDFTSSFIVTLAPVATALLPLKPYLTSLVRRLLTTPPSEWENLPAIIRAFLKRGVLQSMNHLSGFNHFDLEISAAGKMIDWYNVQMYNGWGDASSPGLYRAVIDCGWSPERIVLGVLTNPGNGGSGHVPCDRLRTVVSELREQFAEQFGGVMGWEYFNAGEERGNGRRNWEWVKELGGALRLTDGSSATALANSTEQIRLSDTTPSATGFPDKDIEKLIELGFDRAEAVAALEAMGGDVDQAATLLFGDDAG